MNEPHYVDFKPKWANDVDPEFDKAEAAFCGNGQNDPTGTQDTEDFLSLVYHATTAEKAIDLIFDHIDTLCWRDAWEEINMILDAADFDRLGKTASCSLLTISFCVRSKLSAWEPFRQKCMKRWPGRDGKGIWKFGS